MRKIKMILCICLCASLLCACNGKDPVYLEPVNFYYCNQTVSYNSPAALISPEVREAAGFENDIIKFMEEYLKGPISDELKTVIPAGTTLCTARIQDDTVLLDFSHEFANLSGIDLTTSCVCIVKSLHEFAGIETVVFRADSSLFDEKDSFTLSMEDIVTMDTVTLDE